MGCASGARVVNPTPDIATWNVLLDGQGAGVAGVFSSMGCWGLPASTDRFSPANVTLSAFGSSFWWLSLSSFCPAALEPPFSPSVPAGSSFSVAPRLSAAWASGLELVAVAGTAPRSDSPPMAGPPLATGAGISPTGGTAEVIDLVEGVPFGALSVGCSAPAPLGLSATACR